MKQDFSNKRIFVQIASYRDPQCHPTIRDLFEKAAHPERVFVGVCWQYDPQADMDCFATDYPRAEQVQVLQYHIRDAQGAGWARNEAQSLWRGEEYVLQIQAHMRFEPGWDETLITMLEELPTDKAILTAWLPGYKPPRHLQRDGQFPVATVNRIGSMGDAQMVHLIKRMMPEAEVPDQPILTCSWVGNFMFCRASVLQEVPFDPHIYFWGEEINYSARLWTYGYDMYHLNKVVLYHYWDREAARDAGTYRDHGDLRNQRSLMRNLHLFGISGSMHAEVTKDIEKYPLGTARPLGDYWQFAGIDLIAGHIAPHARMGQWEKRMPKNAPRIFVAIAAHRDPECTHTIADMFAKAAYPDRLRVGLCLQFDPKDDAHCAVTSPREKQIRRIELHHRDSKGANWARAQAMSLMQGEEYMLQIDSHMRFEPGWDETLIDMLARCPSQKAVISTYLPNYDPPDLRSHQPGYTLRVRAKEFGAEHDPQLLHVSGVYILQSDRERSGLYPSPFCVANFIFARSALAREVPIDPHIYFYGDEITCSARLWTHGWDIFQPDRTVLYHYWIRKESLPQQHYRSIRTEHSRRSLMRVRHVLGFAGAADKDVLTDITQYGLGAVRELRNLWAFAGVDWQAKTLTQDALEGKWNLAARDASRKEDAPDARPRIFVQIASYRDPDCQNTVQDLFEKAAHPERIFVGICWQFIEEEDADCFQVPYPRPDQVRVHAVDARKSKGIGWARSITQSLWEGEEFTLVIDAHMRFEQGWDDIFMTMWKACANPKALLTCYPPGFTPPDTLTRDSITGMSAKKFDDDGILLMHGTPVYELAKAPVSPMPGAFVAAGNLFGPASIIKDVPYDPHIYFFGEEITLAVRLWTHGYDIYHPNKLVIYHDWVRSRRKHTHFTDHKNGPKLNALSYARVRHLLGVELSDDAKVIKDIEKYGLGSARSMADYEAYSGIDFARRQISDKAYKGIFGDMSGKNGKANGHFAIGREKSDARIFVQIASYRDRECQWTVKDMFEKAAYPEKISVGICWQYDPKEDEDCFQVSTRPEQVRMLPFDWREGEGVCWARNQTQQLWDGEEYTLQIDSHMRFVPGWDAMMVSELAACEADKPLISCSPASYTPPNNLQRDPRPTIRRVHPFFADGNIRGKGEYIDRSPEKPLNGAFVAAGFMFSRAGVIEEVPYDPYLYFDQEEITYAARLYTHGWDVFSSRVPMLYHYYTADPKGSVRPLHWKDLHGEDKDRIRFLRDRGMNRFNHLVGHRVSTDPEATRELMTYGMGHARNFKQFEDYTGIDFKNKVASERALRCGFIKDLEKYRDKPIHIPELDDKPQAKPKAPEKPAAKTALPPKPKPKAAKPVILETGDFVPFFELPDTAGQMQAIEVYGGRPVILVFLPANDEAYAKLFFDSLKRELAQRGRIEMWQVAVLDAPVDRLEAMKKRYKIQPPLWADADRKVGRAFGFVQGDEYGPVGFVLDNNLKIVHRHRQLPAETLASLLARDVERGVQKVQAQRAEPRILSEIAPALIVPNVFSPEFCDRCIEAFRTGKTFQGTVGAGEKLALRTHAKLRTDHIVNGPLLDEIDDKLSRSLFPEIKKVFGFEVTNRERYKIGLYSGDDGGFFKAHRDNFDTILGYRRIAMTLHLSDDYEGGGLRFPEYGGDIHRPAKGSAIAFSCGTMHEALPVTKGERFILVGFFHGDEDEAYRKYFLNNAGKPYKREDYTPVRREYPELKQSRDFYQDWRREHVAFDDGRASSKPPVASGDMVLPGGHKPRKVYESGQMIVYDDFLPPEAYEKIHAFALKTDYEYINTKGKVARAWHLHDGSPLRSALNAFYYAKDAEKPAERNVYPTKQDIDLFLENLAAAQPHVAPLVGSEGGEGWHNVSATCWIYPQQTGLSMHDDGSGVYTGAYVYFLNREWRSHWGGLLVMMDEEANKAVYDHRGQGDENTFYKLKYFHGNALEEKLLEHGMGKCIFPKGNRMVFIASNAYHMVTRVNEAAGDHARMSVAGFFSRKKK